MAKETVKKLTCDLCKCEVFSTDANYDKWVELTTPVRFDCSQNDGYPTLPYLSVQTLDMCPECQERLVDEWPILGHGAMGYFLYKIKEELK